MSWHAIWSEGRTLKAPQAPRDAPLRSMTLWLELSGPRRPLPKRGRGRPKQVPLRLWRGMADDPHKAITVYLMPDNALRLVHGDIHSDFHQLP